MSKAPKVSVLIPLYNGIKFIEEAIESVLNQSFDNFELIIVDNKSNDGSFELIQKFKFDSRVKIFQNEKNIGMVQNWNQAVLFSQGEYIKFLFSDDYFEKGLLEEYIKIMDFYPQVSLVSSVRKFLHKDNTISILSKYFIGLRPGNEVISDVVSNYLNPIGEPTLIMFRRKHLYVGLFNTDLYWLADIDFWLRLCSIGDVYIMEKSFSVFRIHDDQQTQILIKQGKFANEERDFIYYNYFIRNTSLKLSYENYNKTFKKHYTNLINSNVFDKTKALNYLEIFSLKDILKLKINALKI